MKYCFFNRLEETLKLFVNLLSPHVKFSQTPKIGDLIVSRVHTWWLYSYDVLNGFGMK